MLQRLLDAIDEARARIRSSGGFTLVELLIVIVILGVLAGVVVFAVGAFNDRGERAACQADFKAVEVAVEAYRAKNNEYPASIGELVPDYLRQEPSAPDCTIELAADGTLTVDGVYQAESPGGGDGEEEPQAPGPVTGLAVEGNPTTDSATITWNAVDGATSYSIELTGGQGANTFTSDAAPFTFSGLAAGTNYTATVQAMNDAGAGDPATISFATASPPFSHTFDLSGSGNADECGGATVLDVVSTSTYTSRTMPANAPAGQYRVTVRYLSVDGAGLRFRFGGSNPTHTVASSSCNEAVTVATVNLGPGSLIEFRRNGGSIFFWDDPKARVDYITVTQIS